MEVMEIGHQSLVDSYKLLCHRYRSRLSSDRAKIGFDRMNLDSSGNPLPLSF